MKTYSIRQKLLRSTMIGSASLMALVAAPVVLMTVPTPVMAQDYTSGTLSGSVQGNNGQPVAGATVTVRSTAQGFTRTATTNDQGQFRVPLIPTGGYAVSVAAAGYDPIASDVRVNLGESSYTFTLGTIADATSGEVTVDEIVVTGVRQNLDFAQTTKGVSLNVDQLLEEIPIARNITAVTLLAPTVVEGTGGFEGLPSIGGSTVAENAFYLNGLNITNFDTYVGGSTVPFDFYETVEVKTGGYPAEYGRATGGVINAVTKSGSNEFEFGLHGNFRPSSLEEVSPDTNTIGGQSFNTRDKIDQTDYTIEVGGPIIPDRLFAYGLYQFRDLESESAANSTFTRQTTDDPFFGVKLDGYLTDTQHFEATYFDTTQSTLVESFAYNGGTDTIGAQSPDSVTESGGESYVFKYTGSFTDWFTLSAAYGVNEDQFNSIPADTTSSVVVDATTITSPRTISNQRTTNQEFSSTRREFYRVDGDFYFDFLGQHHVRAGYDNEKNTLFHILQRTGGRRYTIRRGEGTAVGYGVAAGRDFIEVATLQLGGTEIESENQSIYIQDAWDVNDRLSFQIGLRYDDFSLGNLLGEEVLGLDGNYGPRVGFTYDPIGEGRDKIYGSYGRYYIPPASNLSFRGADLGFSEFYNTQTGSYAIGPDGRPVLGTQITEQTNPTLGQTFNITPCPVQAVTAGPDGCRNTFGLGIPERAFSKTSQEIEATYEDEFILGYTRQVNELWTAGFAFTYRDLKRVSEDITLDPYVVQYCAENGFDVAACEAIWDGSRQYVVINPGEDITIYTRGALPGDRNPVCFGALAGSPDPYNCGTLISLSAEDLGFPKPKREYIGLEFNFERAFDGVWSLQGSYVLSRSKGNYEGTVLSDVGQDDAGSTQLFDFLGLSDFQNGLLPNDHRHQIKLFGSYKLFENFLVGGNLSVVSPQSYSCLGVHPDDQLAASYGSASRFCAGEPAPRGSRLESDWVTKMDLSFRYTVPTAGFVPGNLVLRADIFNLFDSDSSQQLDETFDDDGATPLDTYGNTSFYQTPRSIRLGFDYQF